MADIDLVPAAYRRLLALQRRLQYFALLFVVVLACVVLTKVALGHNVRGLQSEIDRLDAAFAIERDRQTQLQVLRKRYKEAERRTRVLAGLRGGTAARDMFRVIDRAGDGQVWFTDWNFRRAGEIVDNGPKAVHSGYFLIIPIEEQARGKKQNKAWLLRTHMEIRARAHDHKRLADFVLRLVQQPEIEDVKVLSTSTQRRSGTEVVDFQLAVVVRTAA